MRTLIAEDDPVSRLWLETELRSWGHDPVVTRDGVQAWRALRAEDTPTLAIIDWMMPGLDGLQLCKNVRAVLNAAPIYIILLTVRDRKEDVIAGLNAGADDYVVKSFEDEELQARIHVGARFLEMQKHLLERVRIDEARREQLRMKDSLLSYVSHELRTPLQVISYCAELLLSGEEGAITDSQREFLERSVRSVDELAGMVSDLVDAGRVQTGKLSVKAEPTQLAPLIADVVTNFSMLAAKHDITVTGNVDAYLPVVHADADRVRQVFTNLISNALKFTPEGGTITVAGAVRDDEPGMVRFSVTDSGCGIAADAVEHIFERFYQADGRAPESRKGLGLGLYICRELVVEHHGHLWCESEFGRGSTFIFTLPIAVPVANAPTSDAIDLTPAAAVGRP